MEDQHFFERLEKALANIQSDFELSSKHDALMFWYLLYKFDLDPDDLKDRIVHDGHAEGVDAVVLNVKNNTFYIVQAKSSTEFKGVARNFSENDIKSTLAGARFLLKGDYKSNVTPQLENLMDEYHEFERTGDYKTKVLFIAERQPPVDDKYIVDFLNENHISVELVLFLELKEFYEREYQLLRSPPPPKISFAVTSQPLQKDLPFRSAVFTIKAEELAKTYAEHRERIFQQNVRDPMGVKGVINKLIFKTAIDKEAAKNFWYFNNGINLVCKKLHLSASGKVVTLDEPQIINGAQTTHSIHEAYANGELAEGVEVLVKVAEVVDRNFVDQITLYSNAQNAIRLRDLSSNDQIQDKLQKILLDSFGVFYQRKRGEFDMMFPTQEAKEKKFGAKPFSRILDNEKIGLTYLSTYLNRPVEAKQEKYKVFYKEAGFYPEIFNDGVNNLAERFLFIWKLNDFVNNEKREYRRRYNATQKSGALDPHILNDFFITQADFFISNLMYRDILKMRDLTDTSVIRELTQAVEIKSAVVINAYRKAVDLIRAQYLADSQKPGNYINRFFKSQRSIVLLQEKI